jgi:hypothetical protein
LPARGSTGETSSIARMGNPSHQAPPLRCVHRPNRVMHRRVLLRGVPLRGPSLRGLTDRSGPSLPLIDRQRSWGSVAPFAGLLPLRVALHL